MIKSLMRRAATWVVRQAASSAMDNFSFPLNGLGLVPRRDVEGWLREYIDNPRLRSVVGRIAEDRSKVRWRLYRVDPNDPSKQTRVHDHPVLRLLFGVDGTGMTGRPNPFMSGRKMRKLDGIYQELAGESFIWIKRDKPFGEPKELWPIPPHWVSDIPRLRQSRSGNIVFDPMFRFNFGGAPQEMLMTEIVWRYEANPGNPYWRGVGAAQAVDDEVSQLSFMAKYNNSFFRNQARPDAIVSLEGTEKGEVARFKEWWLSNHTGFERAFIPAFTSSKATVSLLGATTHQDMQFVEGSKLAADIIRQNWNVPPELIGDMSVSSRGASDSAMRFHAENNIVPRADDDQEDWNHYLLPLFEDSKNLFLAYESPVQETNDFILKRANEGLTRGAWTVDEYRIETGKPPLGDAAGGNERLVPVNVNVILPDGTMTAGPGQSQDGQTVPGTRPIEMKEDTPPSDTEGFTLRPRPNGKAMITLVP